MNIPDHKAVKQLAQKIFYVIKAPDYAVEYTGTIHIYNTKTYSTGIRHTGQRHETVFEGRRAKRAPSFTHTGSHALNFQYDIPAAVPVILNTHEH